MQNEEQQPYYKVTSPVKKTPKKRKIVQQNIVQEEYIDIEATNKPKAKAKTKVKRETLKVVKKEPTVEPYKKQVITIERRDSQNDIKEIIARFKKNNNPALSLFVAKKYYELGNYEQAYNYSLITNSINNDIEESWLVFAKSLVKLNRKEMAIKTLKEYIKYSHSGNARILLNDIESGKFK
jgi:tetratricopeptide (TPR) repeat protein